MKHSQYCKVHNGMYCDCGVVEDERDRLAVRVKYFESELKTANDILIILKPAHDKLAEQNAKMLGMLKLTRGDHYTEDPLMIEIGDLIAEIER